MPPVLRTDNVPLGANSVQSASPRLLPRARSWHRKEKDTAVLRSGNNKEAVPAGISAAFGQQYSCLENPHRQRSLEGYNPWGHKESDTIERLTSFLVSGRPPSVPDGILPSASWSRRLPLRVWGQPHPDSPRAQNLDSNKACAGGVGTLTRTGWPGVPLSFPTKGLGSPYLSQETDGLGSFVYHGHRQEGAGCLSRRGEVAGAGKRALVVIKAALVVQNLGGWGQDSNDAGTAERGPGSWRKPNHISPQTSRTNMATDTCPAPWTGAQHLQVNGREWESFVSLGKEGEKDGEWRQVAWTRPIRQPRRARSESAGRVGSHSIDPSMKS